MKKYLFVASAVLLLLIAQSFRLSKPDTGYHDKYRQCINRLTDSLVQLRSAVLRTNLSDAVSRNELVTTIHSCRLQMKSCDIWLRYLEPLAQKQINGPLPVEWETEVFEKFEKPYRREGAGLLLAENLLSEEQCKKDELLQLVDKAIDASKVYMQDSIVRRTVEFDHFLFANRLHLLNLASLYTTGFECPDADRVIPELASLMSENLSVYALYNEAFPGQALPASYVQLYAAALRFVQGQPQSRDLFDHFTFLSEYVNRLYQMNATLIRTSGAVSHSTLDYALNKEASTIFDKNLYEGQSTSGVYANVTDKKAIAKIDEVGRLLFFDPILSGNGERSCASCHKTGQFFTDTTLRTAEQFDHNGFLVRNTPSLINAPYNHLAMADGAHITLQNQTIGVLTNPKEMNCSESELLKRVLSCNIYRETFEALLPYTPQYKEVNLRHVSSALTYYYGKFSKANAAFDRLVARNGHADIAVSKGFNIFMGKAQCATCHFVPQFNGVKPPFIGSEFEVLGTPADPAYAALSSDSGRYKVNPAPETLHAFRTGSLRNIARTAPYMHNGVFRSLDEVIDFYDFGGGVGHGLSVPNQTLSADSLHLTIEEKDCLKAFLYSLNEDVKIEKAPQSLPATTDSRFAKRTVGGIY